MIYNYDITTFFIDKSFIIIIRLLKNHINSITEIIIELLTMDDYYILTFKNIAMKSLTLEIIIIPINDDNILFIFLHLSLCS